MRVLQQATFKTVEGTEVPTEVPSEGTTTEVTKAIIASAPPLPASLTRLPYPLYQG